MHAKVTRHCYDLFSYWPANSLLASIATNVGPCPQLVLSTWLSLRMSLRYEVPVMCPLGVFLLGVVPSVVGIVRVITAAGTTLGTAPIRLVIWAHPVPVATSILAIRVVCAWAEATSSLGSRGGGATVATELPRRGLLVLWLWRLLCDGLALLYGRCWQKYLCILVYSVAYHSVGVCQWSFCSGWGVNGL